MPLIETSVELKLFDNASETLEPESGSIQGSIPDWLKGTYIRVGPGQWDFEDFTMTHLLDGYAIMTKFTIQDGSVTLEKKYLQSDAYKRALAAKKPVVNEFGTRGFPDPNKGFFSRVVSSLIPEMSDNNYSTPFQFGSEVFLGADTPFFRTIDLSNLACKEKHDGNKCFGCTGLSAHPVLDDKGDLWQLGCSVTGSMKYVVVKVPGSLGTNKEALKKAKAIVTVPSRWNGALGSTHSFGMSSKYIIIVEQPHVLCLSKILGSVVKGDSTIKDWMEWRSEEKNRFIIVEKATGKVVKTDFLSAQPFYFKHVINCYDEDDQIIVDVNCYDSPNVLETLFMSKLRGGQFETCDLPYAQRFVVPLVDINEVEEGVNLVTVKSSSTAIRSGSKIIIKPEVLTQTQGAELPNLNGKYFGKKYSYYYAAGTYNPSSFSHSICKVNVDKKEILTWKESETNYPGEPLFVANPKGTDEDDGILLSAVTDSRRGVKDFLLILNAKNLTEMARVAFENGVPTGLHGTFVPSP